MPPKSPEPSAGQTPGQPTDATEEREERPLTGTVIPATPRQKFHRYLIQRAQVEGAAQAESLIDQQMSDIFAAANPDDLWAAMALDGLTALKDMDNGELLTITGYHVAPGGSEYKSPAYAVVDAFYTRTGQNITIDTGVERVLGFLRAVESGQAGLTFPVDVKVDKKVTANGTAVTFIKP